MAWSFSHEVVVVALVLGLKTCYMTILKWSFDCGAFQNTEIQCETIDMSCFVNAVDVQPCDDVDIGRED